MDHRPGIRRAHKIASPTSPFGPAPGRFILDPQKIPQIFGYLPYLPYPGCEE